MISNPEATHKLLHMYNLGQFQSSLEKTGALKNWTSIRKKVEEFCLNNTLHDLYSRSKPNPLNFMGELKKTTN